MFAISRGITHGKNLATLSDDALAGIDVDCSAVQTPARPLNQARDDEDTAFPRDLLQLLPRPVTPVLLPVRQAQFPLDPLVPRAGSSVDGVTEINRRLEVLSKLIPPLSRAASHRGAKRAASWIPADESLR